MKIKYIRQQANVDYMRDYSYNVDYVNVAHGMLLMLMLHTVCY